MEKAKEILGIIYKKLYGIKGIALILYTSFSMSMGFISTQKSIKLAILWSVISLIISIIVCPLIISLLSKIFINEDNKSFNTKKNFAIFFVLSFCIFLIGYIIWYPGTFALDAIRQIEQVNNNQFSDWHPFIHTLLAVKIPLKLTGGWIGSIVLAQIIAFSLVISYALVSIRKFTNTKYVVFAFLFIFLNPYTIFMGLIVLKDTSFAIGALLLTVYALNIYFTDGLWAKKKINIVMLIAVITLTTLVRHNACLFTIPYTILILLLINKKRACCIVAGVLLLTLLIKVPLYNHYNVTNPLQRNTEVLGVPINIIGSVAKYDSGSLDKETKKYIFSVAPKEVWKKDYVCGNYNTIKWDKRVNNLVTEKYGKKRVCLMALKTLKNSPFIGMKSIAKSSGTVFSITDNFRYPIHPYIPKNEVNVKFKGNKSLSKIHEKIANIIKDYFPFLFVFVGAMQLVLLFSGLTKCRLRTKKGWLKFAIIIPVFAYNLGTSLLLTNVNDGSRFFYYTFIIMPVLLVFFYRKEE